MIVEGILANVRYRDMLLELIQQFEQYCYAYYFDVSFEETLSRHKKSKHRNSVK